MIQTKSRICMEYTFFGLVILYQIILDSTCLHKNSYREYFSIRTCRMTFNRNITYYFTTDNSIILTDTVFYL